VVSPPAGPLASLLVSIELPDDVDNAALHQALRERHRISTKKIPRDEHFNGLRFSAHVYNREENYDKLAAALEQELGPGP